MPSPFDPALMSQLMSRKVSEWDADSKRKAILQSPTNDETPSPSFNLSPHMAMLLGQGLDSASTYAFLKAGHREGNSAMQSFNSNPELAIPAGIAGGLGYHMLYKLLERNHPKLADTAAGLLGGYHMALGGHNLEPQTKSSAQAAGTNLLLTGK